MIPLTKIRIDGGTQSRTELNQDVVAEYAEAYRAGAQMPPVTVFFDGASFWLADGFHRYFGAKAAGLAEIHEERQPGAQRDAVLFSLSANAKHGLRRSNADKRRAVETLLADPEWATWPQAKIAGACGVSREYVNRLVADSHLVIDHKIAPVAADARKPIIGNSEDRNSETPAPRTVTRNGTTYAQNTANIGTRPAQPVAADHAPEAIAPAPTESTPPTQSELEELREFCTEQGANLKATLEENESMARVFESDDRIVAALAEAKRFGEMNRVLTERKNGLMNELAESVRLLKSWKRRAEKAEAALKEAGHAA